MEPLSLYSPGELRIYWGINTNVLMDDGQNIQGDCTCFRITVYVSPIRPGEVIWWHDSCMN
jgi:hypothetical protein